MVRSTESPRALFLEFVMRLLTRLVLLVPWVVLATFVHTESRGEEGSRAEFVRRFCAECHGPTEPEADFEITRLSGGAIPRNEVADWQRVFEQIVSGAMPPRDASRQPTALERTAVLRAIRDDVTRAGGTIDDSRRRHPSHGNWVDHDTLFSGKPAGDPVATRGRLWRVTDRAYEDFVQQMNATYRLGFKTYGHTRVRAPWELGHGEGFGDYANLHRIGEPEIEHHLRNATRVARAMVRVSQKSRDLTVLRDLLRAEEPTDEQLRTSTAFAFEGLLNREPTDEELDRYTGFLTKSAEDLGTERGLEQLLIAILFHSEVMYRLEVPIETDESAAPLPPRELARSLAYALTDRAPDEPLLAAAESGALVERDEVRGQVRRMLEDESIAKPRVLRFFSEWFGYAGAIEVFKDPDTRKAAGFRGKNDWHPDFFVSDADRLIASIVARDRDVLRELLTTHHTFTVTGDSKQAESVRKNADKPFSLFAQTALDVYEIDLERSDWSDERAFAMPREHRRGLLTHPAWLIAHSTNFDNHAIARGRWIRERLLGGHIPEIPVTVDAQLPDEPEHTLRHRMRVTREDFCWRCHREMDPLGLTFETFDHFGRFRETELGEPVDATGRLDGTGDPELDGPVENAIDLMDRLARSKRVEQVFVRHVFRYFVGRNETLADGPTLVAAHRAYVEGDGSLNDLITEILVSDAFLLRRRTTDETNNGRGTTQP